MPTRFYNHFRRAEDLLVPDLNTQHEHHTIESPKFEKFANLPGPLAFLTSGYAVALLAMALLFNRIRHIVVPPRHSLVHHLTRHYAHGRTRQSLFRIVLSSLFPLNLSSSISRLFLRSPSIYLLWRSLTLFSIILLQTSNLFPSYSWLASAAEWGSRTEMKEACWNTFISVCLALLIEALTRSLEGRRHRATPFNLFGYAFLLHIYSSPVTHQTKHGDRGPTRPDKHVLLTIIIPLFQLTMLHTLSTRRRWANQRLIPTSICGLLTLLHFHYVLFFSPTPYPLINYLPSVLESVLLIIILLTISLHALTQLLLEGHITRPLLGHSNALIPRWDEDFAVALLRVGTASLEATSAAGLGNEVVGVGATTLGKEAEVELGRAQLLGMRSAPGSRHRTGFENEIKHVKAVTVNDSDGWIDMVWLREWTRFLRGAWALFRGTWRMLRRATWKRLGMSMEDEGIPGQLIQEEDREARHDRPNIDQDDEAYQQFLRGEEVSDDEDEFVDESERPRDGSYSPSETGTEAEGSESEGHEAAALYADLSSRHRREQSSTPPPLAPVLLAHMTSESPLTRRQYSRFLTRPEDGWADFIDEHRSRRVDPRAAVEDDPRRNCVVCTVEARDVICWPCRCLALCDDCRANLASRFPASKHTCPCCRRNVEGYSRIYIP